MRIWYETSKSLLLSSHPRCCEFFEKDTDGDFIPSLLNPHHDGMFSSQGCILITIFPFTFLVKNTLKTVCIFLEVWYPELDTIL